MCHYNHCYTCLYCMHKRQDLDLLVVPMYELANTFYKPSSFWTKYVYYYVIVIFNNGNGPITYLYIMIFLMFRLYRFFLYLLVDLFVFLFKFSTVIYINLKQGLKSTIFISIHVWEINFRVRKFKSCVLFFPLLLDLNIKREKQQTGKLGGALLGAI